MGVGGCIEAEEDMPDAALEQYADDFNDEAPVPAPLPCNPPADVPELVVDNNIGAPGDMDGGDDAGVGAGLLAVESEQVNDGNSSDSVADIALPDLPTIEQDEPVDSRAGSSSQVPATEVENGEMPLNAAARTGAAVVPAFLLLLKEGDVKEKAYAAAVIRDMATDHEIRLAVAAAHGVPLLIALLRSSHRAQKINAAAALANLASNEAIQAELAQSNGIQPLEALLHTTNGKQISTAVRALRSIFAGGIETVVFATKPGIASLVRVVRGGSIKQKEHAAGALKCLSAFPPH